MSDKPKPPPGKLARLFTGLMCFGVMTLLFSYLLSGSAEAGSGLATFRWVLIGVTVVGTLGMIGCSIASQKDEPKA